MRIESHPSARKRVDRTQIGFGGRFLIWALAVLVYGGGLGCWFVLADRVDKLLGWNRQPDYDSRGRGDPWWAEPSGASDEIEETLFESLETETPQVSAQQTDGWPRVKVVGVMAQQNGAGAAILDGAIVPVGASHAGVKVVAVDKSRVILEYKGNVQIFYPGTFTR